MSGRAIRDSVLAVVFLVAIVGFGLWLAWMTEWAPNQRTFSRAIAALILVGFVCVAGLYAVLVGIYRSDVYAGRAVSPLHLPSIASAGSLVVYFGIASISAVDVFYKPAEPWPLLRDPGVRLIATALIFAIIAANTWLLYEIVHGRAQPDRPHPEA